MAHIFFAGVVLWIFLGAVGDTIAEEQWRYFINAVLVKLSNLALM